MEVIDILFGESIYLFLQCVSGAMRVVYQPAGAGIAGFCDSRVGKGKAISQVDHNK